MFLTFHVWLRWQLPLNQRDDDDDDDQIKQVLHIIQEKKLHHHPNNKKKKNNNNNNNKMSSDVGSRNEAYTSTADWQWEERWSFYFDKSS